MNLTDHINEFVEADAAFMDAVSQVDDPALREDIEECHRLSIRCMNNINEHMGVVEVELFKKLKDRFLWLKK